MSIKPNLGHRNYVEMKRKWEKNNNKTKKTDTLKLYWNVLKNSDRINAYTWFISLKHWRRSIRKHFGMNHMHNCFCVGYLVWMTSTVIHKMYNHTNDALMNARASSTTTGKKKSHISTFLFNIFAVLKYS